MNSVAHDGHDINRSSRHDSYYCAECDEWLEPTCLDSSCDYCAQRPERPSQAD